MRARLRLIGAVLVVVPALAAALAGCATTDAPRPGAAEVAPAADCLAPQVVEDLGLRLDSSGAARSASADAPAPGAVPQGFTPVGAIVCETGGQLTDSKGIWDSVTVRHLEGDLDPLLAALDRPSAVRSSDPTCAAVREVASELWLVDALGRGIRAAQPVDACGTTQRPVVRALDQLDEVDVTRFPVHLAAARAGAPTPTTGPGGG